MPELPKIVRARLNAVSSGDHPEPDVLNAFAEKALTAAERTHVLIHLSRCADCRDVVALAVPAEIEKSPADTSIDTGRGAFWSRWRVLRWGALAACVVIVGSAVLMKRNLMMSDATKTVAIHEEPVANQLAYERRTDSMASSSRERDEVSRSGQDAAMNAALRPPSNKLTGEGQAQALKKALPQMPPTPAPMPMEKKDRGSFVAGVGHGAGVGGAGVAGKLQGLPMTPPAPLSEGRQSMPAQSRITSDLAPTPKSSEVAGLQNAAAAPEAEAPAGSRDTDKKEAPGKAKPASSPLFDRMTDETSETATSHQFVISNQIAAKANRERAYLASTPVSRWTISSNGQLQHSIDSGRTWQPVAVADHAAFRALSANGPDIWVGGSSGVLYHSVDSGGHWQQVKPTAGGAHLTADVAAIEFIDVRRGKVTTSTGEIWLTDDAGQTWHKQP